jgi:hypothetical protein
METVFLPSASKTLRKTCSDNNVTNSLYDFETWEKINRRELGRIFGPRRAEICGG